jgi:tyrosine-protein kinase Etk/Wzc
VPLGDAIQGTREKQLYVLPTGSIPRNPAELLSSQSFEHVLKEASRQFDLVIVDTPPILAVTDSLLVARFASINLLVLRAGHHPIRDIARTVRRLAQTGIAVQGAVLNDLSSSRARSEYKYTYPAAAPD